MKAKFWIKGQPYSLIDLLHNDPWTSKFEGGTLYQAFLTETATRAVIFIKADNSKLGLMCFVAVGMGDVSNNEITFRVGENINKGDQLGMFHFGGSTHVLLFRPEVKLKFNLHGQKAGLDSENIKVHDEILRLV